MSKKTSATTSTQSKLYALSIVTVNGSPLIHLIRTRHGELAAIRYAIERRWIPEGAELGIIMFGEEKDIGNWAADESELSRERRQWSDERKEEFINNELTVELLLEYLQEYNRYHWRSDDAVDWMGEQKEEDIDQ